MYPILYPTDELTTHQTAEPFQGSGIGALSDVIKCTVTEERNGEYELEMQYPMNGIWSDDLEVGQLIKAKANDIDDPQIFQIYDIIRDLSGAYEIKAEHISYRLAGIPVKAFSANGAAAAMAAITANAVIPPGFTFDTDLTSSAAYKIETPRSARAILGGEEGSLLQVYGGEYHFDNFRVSLLQSRGTDRNASIRYGKNLTDLEQEINGSVYNGIYPYWYRENEGLVAPSAAVPAQGDYPVKCYEVRDLTDEFDSKPTAAQLTSRAQALANGMGSPVETLDVSFVSLHQLQEYQMIAALERVQLCDIVHVAYPALGIDVKMRVVKTAYNTIAERYETITLGQLRTTIADLMADALYDTQPTVALIASSLKGSITNDNFNMGSSGTIPAGGYVNLTPDFNIKKNGYYATGVTNTRTGNSGNFVITNMQMNSEHTQIANVTVHNMGTSAGSCTIRCSVLYIREDLIA